MVKLGEIVRIKEDRNKNHILVSASHSDFGKVTEKIIGYINQEPGSGVNQISRGTKIQYSTVYSTVLRVVRSKRPTIKRRIQDGLFRYYPINYRFSGEAPVDSRPATERIIDYVLAHPGADLLQIKNDLNLKLGTASSTLTYLVKRNHIHRIHRNGRWVYFEKLNQEIKPETTETPALTTSSNTSTDSVAFNEFSTQVESAAKDFFWQQQSDSLREFVKWVKEQS